MGNASVFFSLKYFPLIQHNKISAVIMFSIRNTRISKNGMIHM